MSYCRMADDCRAPSASRQVHPPRTDGGHEPRTGARSNTRSSHRSGSLRSRPTFSRTTKPPSSTSMSSASTPRIGRTSSRFRSTSPAHGAPMPWPITTGRRAPSSRSAVCTSLPCQTRLPRTRMPSSSARANRFFPNSSRTSERATLDPDTSRLPAGRWNGCRRSGAT